MHVQLDVYLYTVVQGKLSQMLISKGHGQAVYEMMWSVQATGRRTSELLQIPWIQSDQSNTGMYIMVSKSALVKSPRWALHDQLLAYTTFPNAVGLTKAQRFVTQTDQSK